MEEFTIFTESNEDMGLLFDGYKGIGEQVKSFLGIIEGKISELLKDPQHASADLREEITKFKAAVDKKPTPKPINISKVGATKAAVKNYRSDMEKVLDRYAKARDKMSFGGNLMRSIIMKPKVYSKEIDSESYAKNNRNIRNIERALDWVEKVLIDLFNLIDQDLNILTLVGKVYGKRKIYEYTEIFQSGDFDAYKGYVNMEDHDDDLLDTLLEQSMDISKIPDTLYFSAPIRYKKLQGQVFLSPHIGISSLFIVNRHQVLREYFAKEVGTTPDKIKGSWNIGYDEWDLKGDALDRQVDKVHINHNVPEFKHTMSGVSKGYIHKINISKFKDKLHQHGDHPIDKEIIYQGIEPLPIIEIIPHTVYWEITFSEDNMKNAGMGSVYVMNKNSTFTEASDDPPPNMPTEGDENNGEGKEQPEGDREISQTSDVPTEDAEVHDEPQDSETDQPKEEVKESMPRKTDQVESSKNGVRRKKLYVAFIEWAKEYNSKNTFGSIFDKDIFHNVYPFVPEEMRYFYRLANPILCVLSGDLTFFQVSELKKLNAENKEMDKLLIFAATPNDLRVFNKEDKRIYLATEADGKIMLGESIGDTFDLYIQKMIKKGDILNGPLDSESE